MGKTWVVVRLVNIGTLLQGLGKGMVQDLKPSDRDCAAELARRRIHICKWVTAQGVVPYALDMTQGVRIDSVHGVDVYEVG